MRLKEKRGLTLLEFVIDLIIGIICALLLFYVFSIMYGIFFGGKDKALAQDTLANIGNSISGIEKEGEEIILKVPRGWFLLSFEKGENSEKENVLPQTFCADGNCLCICKPTKIIGLIQTSVDCRKDAACSKFSLPFKENGKDLYIKIPVKDNIKIKPANLSDYYFLDVQRK